MGTSNRIDEEKLFPTPLPVGGIGPVPPPEGFIEDEPPIKPPTGFVLDKPDYGEKRIPGQEAMEKLWTGKLGAKIKGKTPVEHIGEHFKERIEAGPSPPLLTKEFATGFTENLKQTAYQIWGKMPSGEEILKSMETGEPIPEAVQKEYVSVMKPKPGIGKSLVDIAKNVGLGTADFFTWIPTMTAKFIKDPKGSLYNDPVGTLMLGHVASMMVKGRAPVKKPAELKFPEQPTDLKIKKLTSAEIAQIKAEPFKEMRSGFDLKQEIAKSLEYLKTGDIKAQLPAMGLRKKRIGETKLSLRLPPEQEPGLPGVQKVIAAIKHFKPMRAEQEALYTKERGARMAKGVAIAEKLEGEEWGKAMLGAQAGRMQRVPYTSIRNRVTPAEIDGMFKQIKYSPALTEWDKLPAINGLLKLFGELGAEIPTEGELLILEKVFPKAFTKALMSQRDTWTKIKHGVMEVSGIPRAVMAAYDFSFGLRQGAFLAPRFPKQFFSAWKQQFKMFGSEKAFQELRRNIESRPTYNLMRQGKLAITEMDYSLTAREEAFMSHWAEYIPGVRQSARAYTGFANKFRADVFDDFIKHGEKLGLNPKKNPRFVRGVADFINNATGRGKLKKLESSAVVLNNIFFSPRLILSRLKLLTPWYYPKLPKGVRWRAIQSLLAFAGAGASILGLAKLAGLKVGGNPFSADFGKIQVGDTSIDVWGGFQQYIRGILQTVGSKVVSTTTGKVTELGEGYKPLTRTDLALRFAEYKLAPVASFAWDLYRGKTVFGKKPDFKTLTREELTEHPITSRFIPMVIQDMIDLYNEDPNLLPISVLGLFGIGLQTYPRDVTYPKKQKPKKKKPEKEFWY